MANDNYKQALESARAELNDLLAQRSNLDGRIAKLRQTVGSLAQLCGEEPGMESTSEWSLIDAIREVLRAAPPRKFLTADEIKTGLVRLDYDISGNTNILASIQTTLRRMAENNEVKTDVQDDKKVYRLLGSLERIMGSAITGSSVFSQYQEQEKDLFYGPKPKKGKK